MMLRTGEWIEYDDADGHHLAQPDGFLVRATRVLCFEVKLTGGEYGHGQLRGLYLPLLEHIFQRPAFGIQVARGVTPSTPGPFIPDPLAPGPHIVSTWHWPGR